MSPFFSVDHQLRLASLGEIFEWLLSARKLLFFKHYTALSCDVPVELKRLVIYFKIIIFLPRISIAWTQFVYFFHWQQPKFAIKEKNVSLNYFNWLFT